MNYSCKAQQPVLRTLTFQETFDENFSFKKGDYVKDFFNELDPYVGTWKYEGNGKIFILKIQKVPMFYESIGKTYHDDLLVTYKYEKNGTVIVDNLNAPIITSFENLSNSEGKKYNTFSLDFYMNEFFLTGTMKDIPFNISTNAEIHPIDFGVIGVTPKIKIYFNSMISYRGNPESFYVGKPAFEIPNNVELIKQ